MNFDDSFLELNAKALTGLKSGAFLTTAAEGKLNTMTISWGSIGIMWFKPIFMTVVRQSRFSKELLEKNGEFTISVPLKDLKESLSLCGTKSGRDLDKFAAANLRTQPGRSVSVPIIAECKLHYECKVVYRQIMDPNALDPVIQEKVYSAGDYHTMYYGEILNCYLTDC